MVLGCIYLEQILLYGFSFVLLTSIADLKYFPLFQKNVVIVWIWFANKRISGCVMKTRLSFISPRIQNSRMASVYLAFIKGSVAEVSTRTKNDRGGKRHFSPIFESIRGTASQKSVSGFPFPKHCIFACWACLPYSYRIATVWNACIRSLAYHFLSGQHRNLL